MDVAKYNPSNRGREPGASGGRQVDVWDTEALTAETQIEERQRLDRERTEIHAAAIAELRRWQAEHPEHQANVKRASTARKRLRSAP